MSLELPVLYQHQDAQKNEVRSAFGRHREIILCASPGQGKTRMSKWILGAALNRQPSGNQSGNLLFTVHRRGLVDNAIGSFEEHPKIPFGVIMSQRDTAMHRRLQIASIDTLLSWFIQNERYATEHTFDMIVVDECHSHHSKYMTFLEAHQRKRTLLGQHPPFVLGLTATPQATGLSDLYKEIIEGPPTQWLIDQNYLSPFTYYGGQQGQLGLLVRSGQEFTNDSVCAAMKGLAGNLVRDWKLFANGEPTVGFFPRLSHAQEAMEELSAAGINAAYVDAKTPDDQRRNLFYMLNTERLDYLCNVGIVERGTDIPRIGCIQLCTAIGSKVRFKQMVGRGSRIHPNKTGCVVIDHGGNVKRHGYFEDLDSWTLDVTSKDTQTHKDRPTIACPKCKAIYRGGRCRQCGYEPESRERRAQGLRFNGTDLVELEKKKPKATRVKSSEDIMIHCLYACGRSNRTWKQAVGMAYSIARKQGTAFRVPKKVVVAGRNYEMLPYRHRQAGRLVRDLYPFTDRRES